MRFSQTTKYHGLSSIYFNSIIEQIITIGDLNKKNYILDYGCGEKKIQEKLITSVIKNISFLTFFMLNSL